MDNLEKELVRQGINTCRRYMLSYEEEAPAVERFINRNGITDKEMVMRRIMRAKGIYIPDIIIFSNAPGSLVISGTEGYDGSPESRWRLRIEGEGPGEPITYKEAYQVAVDLVNHPEKMEEIIGIAMEEEK